MEKRSRRRIRDLVAQPASLGLSENEIGCARISMVARNTNVPFKGRIQKRKTYHLQIMPLHRNHSNCPAPDMRLTTHQSLNKEHLLEHQRCTKQNRSAAMLMPSTLQVLLG